MPAHSWQPGLPDILDVLNEARVQEEWMLAAGSNYVFLLQMEHPVAGEGYAVYKPRQGEAPLHDFPSGTLYKRELRGLGFNGDIVNDPNYKIGTDGQLVQTNLDLRYSSPMNRYSLFGKAYYELPKSMQVFSQVNFVNTSNRQVLQPSGAVGGFSASIPYGTAIYGPSLNAATGATLWSATLRMTGPFHESPAGDSDDGSGAEDPPVAQVQASDLGVGIAAGESAATRTGLAQAARAPASNMPARAVSRPPRILR